MELKSEFQCKRIDPISEHGPTGLNPPLKRASHFLFQLFHFPFRLSFNLSTITMGSCPFDKLFAKSVPHIMEKIIFSLDYESYKECFEVCHIWNEILTSKRYLKIGKSVFQDEVLEDQKNFGMPLRLAT